ncbi:MAG: VWA domain-containing protein [Oscillospiraceae bacterium]
METGGSFSRLSYKKKRNRRKNLVLLCDVSGSMMQFSEFALRFIQALNQVSESSLVFLFSEEMCHADAFQPAKHESVSQLCKRIGHLWKGYRLGHRSAKAVRHESCCFAGIHDLADSL